MYPSKKVRRENPEDWWMIKLPNSYKINIQDISNARGLVNIRELKKHFKNHINDSWLVDTNKNYINIPDNIRTLFKLDQGYINIYQRTLLLAYFFFYK
jgi:hypothetical protein